MLIEDLQVVLKVAKLNSITAAATQLDISTPTASNALKRIEKCLGVELFVRTTRNLRLSSAGEQYIPQCEDALLVLEQAKKQVQSNEDVVEGELRVAVSSDLGRCLTTQWLNEMTKTYPKLTLRLYLSDSVTDLYRNAIDIALRYVTKGSLDESYLYGHKICHVPHILCASPEYLKQFGTPSSPEELSSHKAVLYQLYDTTHDIWTFHKRGEEFKVKMKCNHIGNDGELVRRWCLDGHGLAIKSILDAGTDLLSGALVNVMPSFKPTPTELWMIMPSKQSISPATRLLRNIMENECSDLFHRLVGAGILDGKDFQ